MPQAKAEPLSLPDYPAPVPEPEDPNPIPDGRDLGPENVISPPATWGRHLPPDKERGQYAVLSSFLAIESPQGVHGAKRWWMC